MITGMLLGPVDLKLKRNQWP